VHQVWAILTEEHESSEEHKDCHDEALPGDHDHDLLPHEGSHHWVLASDAHAE
jgi:hypothetical protein